MASGEKISDPEMNALFTIEPGHNLQLVISRLLKEFEASYL